ncbi:transmembrane protein 79 [Clinocottus analis]|uniref:transmembrane protein 79 n=1 Tax=Clinocottus analis TaxID=304258 RepID=UPI0035C1FEE9
MSGQAGLISTEDEALPPAEPQIAGSKKPEESVEERYEVIDDKQQQQQQEEEDKGEEEMKNSKEEEEEEDKEEKEEEEEEEEMTTSAHLEPNTLPWPEDRDKRPQTDNDDGVRSGKGVSEPEDMELSGGSRDLPEERSPADGKSKWRESMPEGDRWRDDELELQRDHNGGGSLADDEDEGEEEDEQSTWISEKDAQGFSPRVTIVRPSSKELPDESRLFIEDVDKEPQTELDSAAQFHPVWTEPDDKYYLCEQLCGSKLTTALSTAAAGLLFPLLLWGGYALLPFDPPQLGSAPLRVVYTLRCAFFGIVPILLGVVVQGVARLRYSALKPLYQGKRLHREVAVHWHYVNESLALFLIYFLQLAVMATYISQDLLKLVPLLTIIFVFGRLIYWLCLSLDSSIRGLGFGFSFFPILVMLGTNLYFICASVGQGAVFDVEPPTTAPPPKLRWWG